MTSSGPRWGASEARIETVSTNDEQPGLLPPGGTRNALDGGLGDVGQNAPTSGLGALSGSFRASCKPCSRSASSQVRRDGRQGSRCRGGRPDAALAGYRSPVLVCADESCLDLGELDAAALRYQRINIKMNKTGDLTHHRDSLYRRTNETSG
jgi:hypothetical protein